jgi:hypothetical protein
VKSAALWSEIYASPTKTSTNQASLDLGAYAITWHDLGHMSTDDRLTRCDDYFTKNMRRWQALAKYPGLMCLAIWFRHWLQPGNCFHLQPRANISCWTKIQRQIPKRCLIAGLRDHSVLLFNSCTVGSPFIPSQGSVGSSSSTFMCISARLATWRVQQGDPRKDI